MDARRRQSLRRDIQQKIRVADTLQHRVGHGDGWIPHHGSQASATGKQAVAHRSDGRRNLQALQRSAVREGSAIDGRHRPCRVVVGHRFRKNEIPLNSPRHHLQLLVASRQDVVGNSVHGDDFLFEDHRHRLVRTDVAHRVLVVLHIRGHVGATHLHALDAVTGIGGERNRGVRAFCDRERLRLVADARAIVRNGTVARGGDRQVVISLGYFLEHDGNGGVRTDVAYRVLVVRHA